MNLFEGWRLLSSGTWRCVVWYKFIGVLEAVRSSESSVNFHETTSTSHLRIEYIVTASEKLRCNIGLLEIYYHQLFGLNVVRQIWLYLIFHHTIFSLVFQCFYFQSCISVALFLFKSSFQRLHSVSVHRQKPTQLGAIYRARPYLRTPEPQKVSNCIHITSSRTLKSYL
jgi:hypothetical protein